jgi:uncharacterized protein
MLPLWSLLLAIGVEDVPNPRQQNRWVSDTAQIIPAESEARLDALLERIHQQTQAEIAVVTVEVVSGTPKQFATALFNHWGIGSAERNDGVLFLMVMGERRLEVEVGYGLEDSLPDGWLGGMQTSSMVPRFKQRDFAGGLEVGVIEVGRRLGASELPDPSTVPVVPVASAPASNSVAPGTIRHVPRPPAKPGTPWPIYVFYGLLAAGGLGLLGGCVRVARVIHNKRCQPCKTWRTVLPEDEDDTHLSGGQQTEEELGSIDYDVFVCGSCSSVSVMAKHRWFSGHSRCRSCRFRTATTSSRTIQAATTHSSGMAEVTATCHHCNHEHTSLRTIPAKGTSSSGGSSFGGGGGSSFGGGGGSSFGGGRSGGGGAGSSW